MRHIKGIRPAKFSRSPTMQHTTIYSVLIILLVNYANIAKGQWTVETIPAFGNLTVCQSTPGFVCDPNFQLGTGARSTLESDIATIKVCIPFFTHTREFSRLFKFIMFGIYRHLVFVSFPTFINCISILTGAGRRWNIPFIHL